MPVLAAGPTVSRNCHFFPVTAMTIASVHCAYPLSDGQTDCFSAWLNSEMVCPHCDGYPSCD